MTKKFIFSWLFALLPLMASAQFGKLSTLHVVGNQMQDAQGNRVVLHGVADTPNPSANKNRWGTSSTDGSVNKCIEYFEQLYSAITDTSQGSYCNVFRLQLDASWCYANTQDETDYQAFDEARFKQSWEKLYKPLILRALDHGLYVVVTPPGSCPSKIEVGGGYQKYLNTVWTLISKDADIQKNAGFISFELASEPVDIQNAEGKDDSEGTAPHDFFQTIADQIRANGFTGILWVPGASDQSLFTGYENHPVTGYNIGYAARNLIDNFEERVPVAKTAPLFITGIDWTSTTSWTEDCKKLLDQYGISMTLSSTDDYLDVDTYQQSQKVVPAAKGNAEASGEICMKWYKEYSEKNVAYQPFKRVRYSDQGDGTYINPVINSDFPDPDVIRVGNTFYLISTTMFHLPGATLLKSKDLVNWEYCNNPVKYLADKDKYNLTNGQNAYAGGMWASALGYDNGTFYILLQANDAGMYVLTTKDPEGKWRARKLNEGYYDCGMLIEGDYIYVVSGINHIMVSKLDRNFKKLDSKKVIIRDDMGFEGCKMYHIGDYYYIYGTYGGTEGSQSIFRSKTPMGEYEEISGRAMKNQHIHQGALVTTPSGEWWTILFKDDGAIGRVPYLEPVKWVNDWPVIGNNGIDVSKDGAAYPKPNVGQTYPRTTLPTNDTFSDATLGMQWQWNHQQDDSAWSLTENPGYLRLHTVGKAQNLKEARNSLTQRMVGLSDEGMASNKKPQIYGTVKMDVSHMQDGDVAGLSVFQDPYSWVGVKKVGNARHLYVYCQEYDSKAAVETDCGEITSDVVYLQARCSFSNNKVLYYYSTDNQTYKRAGNTSFDMRYILTIFVGQRFYLFNYATKQNGGYVDFDWFSTERQFTEDTYYSPERLTPGSGEDPTGITQITTAPGKQTGWYNLQGMRIQQPKAPGIYIRNNKKLIVK